MCMSMYMYIYVCIERHTHTYRFPNEVALANPVEIRNAALDHGLPLEAKVLRPAADVPVTLAPAALATGTHSDQNQKGPRTPQLQPRVSWLQRRKSPIEQELCKIVSYGFLILVMGPVFHVLVALSSETSTLNCTYGRQTPLQVQ